MPEKPLLATVRRVPLGETGTWNISNIQGWTVTKEDFASAVAALDCPAVRKPVLKFGHTGKHGQTDEPALGFVDNLAVSEDGMTLYGDFVGMPAWLAEVDADGNSVLSSAYPDRSGEWVSPHYCQLGHRHPFVLTAMALLGVERPGIGTLASLHDLYTTAPETKEKTMPKTSRAAASVTDYQVREAYYSTLPEDDWSTWVREMYISPPELIVENNEGGLTRIAYTVGEDDAITFGEAQKVELVYVEAQASAGRREAVFASAAESRNTRSGRRARSAEGDTVDEDTTEGATDSVLRDGLIERLGITDTAISDEDLLAAVDEALAERADDAAPAPGAAAAAPAGGPTVTVDRAMFEAQNQRLATLEAEASARSAREAAQSRSTAISSAIRDGRIAPASRAQWDAVLQADFEKGQAALASLSPGTVPVSEIGHGQDAASADLSWF